MGMQGNKKKTKIPETEGKFVILMAGIIIIKMKNVYGKLPSPSCLISLEISRCDVADDNTRRPKMSFLHLVYSYSLGSKQTTQSFHSRKDLFVPLLGSNSMDLSLRNVIFLLPRCTQLLGERLETVSPMNGKCMEKRKNNVTIKYLKLP